MSMITSEFYRSLEEENSLNATLKILERFPEQMAATIGLDKRPQVRPVRFRFEKDGRSISTDIVRGFSRLYRQERNHTFS